MISRGQGQCITDLLLIALTRWLPDYHFHNWEGQGMEFMSAGD